MDYLWINLLNYLFFSMDEQRRKTGFKRDIPRIELGAVLNATCKKCGGKGRTDTHIVLKIFPMTLNLTYNY